MKKILIFTTTEGHLSIALAIKQMLQTAGFKTYVVDLTQGQALKLYLPFYRYFPSLFKIPYQIGQQKNVHKTIELLCKNLLKKEVKNYIKKVQPDLIISTYLLYNPAIVNFLDYQKTSLPFLNIIANAWTIQSLEVCQEADFNLVYDQKSIKLSQSNHLDKEKVLATGWWIRKQYYQKYSLASVRKNLSLKKNVFTLLICGGSEGSHAILKIIPGLLTIKKPLQVIVVCGHNKTLYKGLLAFKKLFQKIKKKNPLEFKIFQFTQQLPQFMAISDLVVGKAGPNLLFETVAQQKPFFACCHISGQEDGNLDLIKQKKLGWVEEDSIKAVKLLQKIIYHPQILKQFSPSIKKEQQFNLQAGKKLIQTIKKLLDEK